MDEEKKGSSLLLERRKTRKVGWQEQKCNVRHGDLSPRRRPFVNICSYGPQRTLTGHSGHSTFVLRGIIAHQREELVSGHNVTMVEGDAIWVVDDGECTQIQKEVPDHIQGGVVIVWASRAEPSSFWSRAIGSFDPPTKRTRISGG